MMESYDTQSGKQVFGLVSNMMLATKIVKAAKLHHLGARNFDKADALLKNATDQKPALIIMDGDGCEAEAFKFLKACVFNADLKSIPVVGFVSQSKRALKEELARAGCLRVYLKTEFSRELDDLLVRYSK